MKKFPDEFADLLTPYGLRILDGQVGSACSLFKGTTNYFATFDKIIQKKKAELCLDLLDKQLYRFLAVEQSAIPENSISDMKENYSESLSKAMRIKTAFFLRRTARSYKAAESIGLLQMMRSDSFVRFAEAITGYKLNREWEIQVSCYEQGDYVGPHNDHHPESELHKRGFIDVHVMFTNEAVAHHYLVYEQNGHFSRLVDINKQGAVSVYELPFWHYTTPLVGKKNREGEARRWLLLGTFSIVDKSRSAKRLTGDEWRENSSRRAREPRAEAHKPSRAYRP
jgi:hypothetical protein